MIRDYYHREFTTDLAVFLPLSDLPYFGHSWTTDCGRLATVPLDRRAKFLVCLYFTVLIDQGMHSHCASLYARFEALTRYPKFCHGLGQFQKNPRQLLDLPVERGLASIDKIAAALREGAQLFVDETIDFSDRHMPELDPKTFFQTLIYDPDVQIPSLLVMVDPTIKEMPAWKAYEHLRKVVAKQWPPE